MRRVTVTVLFLTLFLVLSNTAWATGPTCTTGLAGPCMIVFSSGSTLTVPVTLGSGSNKALVLLIGSYLAGVTGISCNSGGFTMTMVEASAGNNGVFIYEKTGPPAGSYNCIVTLDSAATETFVGVLPLFNVNSAGSQGSCRSSGLSSSASCTASTSSGTFYLAAVLFEWSTDTPVMTTGQSTRAFADLGGDRTYISDQSSVGASHVVTYTWPANHFWGQATATYAGVGGPVTIDGGSFSSVVAAYISLMR